MLSRDVFIRVNYTKIFLHQLTEHHATHCLWLSPLQVGCTPYLWLGASWTGGMLVAVFGSPMGAPHRRRRSPLPKGMEREGVVRGRWAPRPMEGKAKGKEREVEREG